MGVKFTFCRRYPVNVPHPHTCECKGRGRFEDEMIEEDYYHTAERLFDSGDLDRSPIHGGEIGDYVDR